MEKISFKYFPDPVGLGSFTNEGGPVVCECCGKETGYYYALPIYSTKDVDNICIECVANGKAAEKFDGEFIGDYDVKVTDPDKVDELLHRTPCYASWQDPYWVSHCGDFCAFIDYVGMKELEDMDLADKLEDIYMQDESMFDLDTIRDRMLKDGSLQGYLFKCLLCGKYRLYADCD